MFDRLLIHIYKVTIDIYAHITSFIQSLTSSRISSKVMGIWRWNPSLSVVVISQQSFALRSRFNVTLPFISKWSEAECLQLLHQSRCGRWWWWRRLCADHAFIVTYHVARPPNLLVVRLVHHDQPLPELGFRFLYRAYQEFQGRIVLAFGNLQ